MQQISSSNQKGASLSGQESPGGGAADLDGKLGAVVVNVSPSERDAIIKQNGFRTGVDVTRKLNDIKNERKGLRTQLD